MFWCSDTPHSSRTNKEGYFILISTKSQTYGMILRLSEALVRTLEDMITRAYSATLEGAIPLKIDIEVETTPGLPGCTIIGMPTQAVAEAKERITAALLTNDIAIQAKKTIINLAPADVKKTSSHLELGIAVCILKHYGISIDDLSTTLFIGELSLDGTLKPVRGALSLVLAARRFGFKSVVIPAQQAGEVSLVSGITIYPLDSLTTYLDHAHQKKPLTALRRGTYQPHVYPMPLLTHIKGQQQALRALTIAAAGRHPLLFLGPPGAGKSILAKLTPHFLPSLTESQALEVTQMHSLAGILPSTAIMTIPPFRMPHHTTSLAGLLGGGQPFKPGELSLAHYGVLFLDELPEFRRDCLEALREPLETKMVAISRAGNTTKLPANMLLIAAANPCPCGYAGSATTPCRCSPHQRDKYIQKFSGPLLDRIDLQVWVNPIDATLLMHTDESTHGLDASTIQEEVCRAHAHQEKRYQQTTLEYNSQVPSSHFSRYFCLTPPAHSMLIQAAHNLKLSPRAVHACIRVAQTISDLDGVDSIQETAIAEAVQYRQQLLPDMIH